MDMSTITAIPLSNIDGDALLKQKLGSCAALFCHLVKSWLFNHAGTIVDNNWSIVSLSNGGFCFKREFDGYCTVTLFNGFTCRLTTETTGIVASINAFSTSRQYAAKLTTKVPPLDRFYSDLVECIIGLDEYLIVEQILKIEMLPIKQK